MLEEPKKTFVTALAGQPNVGKSTVFNLLTGLSQHVGNWPGKTIEQKTGTIHHNDLTLELKLDGQKLLLDKATADCLMAIAVSPTEGAADEEIPMSMLQTGESGVLKSYAGGKGMLGRCLSMGFTPGSTLKMMENFGSGPLLVKVHDAEVALGRGIAAKMMVTRMNPKC